MEAWILVMAIAGGDGERALSFSNEQACHRFVRLLNRDNSVDWIGRCITEREYRRSYPHIPLDRGS